MRLKDIILMGAASLSAAALSSCSSDIYEANPEYEDYTRAFIKTFGLIDENQDWNMAESVGVELNVSGNVKNLKLYSKTGTKYYLVADLHNVSGKINVPINVPEGTSDLLIKADGAFVEAKLGNRIDIKSNLSRTMADPSGGIASPNYSVTITRPEIDGEEVYEYYSSKQLCPITNTTAWDDYYSLNSNTFRYNNPVDNYRTEATDESVKEIGVAPEGETNLSKAVISEDFTIETKADGSFTLYPMYWNTRRDHTLGFYILEADDSDPENVTYSPVMVEGQIARYPIYIDKSGDDLQVFTQKSYVNVDKWVSSIPESLKTKYGDGSAEHLYTITEDFENFKSDYYALFFNRSTRASLGLGDDVMECYDGYNSIEIKNNYSNANTVNMEVYCEFSGRVDPENPSKPGSLIGVGGTWTSCTSQYAFGSSSGIDEEVLCRSRGFNVKILNNDGTPFHGRVGMYIEFKDQAPIWAVPSENRSDPNLFSGENTWIVYSQTNLNMHLVSESNGETPVCHAGFFKHPVSGRLFFGFEDWMGNSSDNDLNDLLFLLSDAAKVVGTVDFELDSSSSGNEEYDGYDLVEDGYRWLVAAEDLGTTDDFDFNDVIFTISIVTESKNYYMTDAEGNWLYDENGERVPSTLHENVQGTQPVVKVQAMAAGGTLVTYLHYYSTKDNQDYILGPNGYVKAGEATTDYEWHKWFGYGSTTMVNTGQNKAKYMSTCEITAIVPDDFSISGYSKSQKNGRVEGFYITVKSMSGQMGDLGGTSISDNNVEHVIGAPATGAAPQMFLIPDLGYRDAAGSENKVGESYGWYWPKERKHIAEEYPAFKNWVEDAEGGSNWHMEEPVHTGNVIRINP